jgi:[amino group carrier protein]-lysine/ornithine hydrolase
MLETYSPSGSEKELSALLLDEMTTNGLEAGNDQAGNVIGEAGREGPRILLCGHMDTVAGPLPVYESDGYIHGRGAVDAKTSLAAMIIGCTRAIHNRNIPFRATIAAVVEEETSSKGIASIASNKEKYDLAVFGEPSGASNIVIGYKGSMRIEITCQTQGGHSSSPWLSRNGLEEAFKFWETLRDTILENNASSKFDAITGSLVNSTSSPGGNSIPNKATLEVDIRIPPRIGPRELIHKLDLFKAKYAEINSEVLLGLQFGNETQAYLGPDDSLGVRAFRYAIRKSTGKNVSLVRKTGTSDMNTLAQVCQAPMIAYGPGDSSLDHTELEKVSILEYLDSIAVYSSAIERFAALAAQTLNTVKA